MQLLDRDPFTGEPSAVAHTSLPPLEIVVSIAVPADDVALLLAGISYLAKAYGITATSPGQPGYQSLLSMLIAAVFGRGIFYYLTIGSILLVLSLSANTAFVDFPRLCRAIGSFVPRLSAHHAANYFRHAGYACK